jgi:hypothetical protein
MQGEDFVFIIETFLEGLTDIIKTSCTYYKTIGGRFVDSHGKKEEKEVLSRVPPFPFITLC